MPTYEYHCEKCGHVFEKVQTMKSAPLKVCPRELCPRPKWGKGRVKRGVGGGSGLLFKGSGFYITDYRSESYKKAASKDVAAPAGGGDSKPAPSKPASAPAAPAKSGGDGAAS